MFRCLKIKKGYFYIVFYIFYILYPYINGVDIDYLVTSNGKLERMDFKALKFNEKAQKLQFLVEVNTFKEFSLQDVCYIRFKNNKGIVFSPIPRVELNTQEILVTTFEGVSNEQNTTYLVFKNPEWSSKKDSNGIRADLTKLRKVIFENVETSVDLEKDYVVFRSGDFDKGFIDTITNEEILMKSEVFGEKDKPALKRYKIKGNKDPKDDIVQIHFAELGNFEFDKNVLYVVVTIGDGSKIIGKLKSIEGEKFTIESVGFGTVEVDDVYIHSIYTVNSKCSFLSDLHIVYSKTYSKALKEIGIEDYALDFKIMRDCSSKDCKPIMLAKEEFPKGLGIHTTTVLKIKLDRKFKKLFSFYGIDDNALQDYGGVGAKAILKIYGDGKIILAKNNVGFSHKLKSFTINVSNVDELKIVVEEPRFPEHKDAFVLGRFSLAIPILTK